MQKAGFWHDLFDRGPVVGLSPMDGVTDAAMRYMTAKYGRPEVLFTEFVSVDALRHAQNPEAVGRLMSAFIRAQDVGSLDFKPYEVAQVFGHDPELFYQAAVIVATLGFDGIDINMGCPAHKVEEHGSGAGLIRVPETALEIIRAAKRGIADWAAGKVAVDDLKISENLKNWVIRHLEEKPLSTIPVSVKTRLGVDMVVVEEWLATLMKAEPAIISLHGRTLKQMYQGSADWEAIGRAAEVVHQLGGHILGNGDVQSIEEGKEKVKAYGVDGFLIGRAAEGNPGVFTGITDPTWEQRKAWMVEHASVFESINKPLNQLTIENSRNWFMPMRKHLAWYCKGFPGASEMREKLVRSNNMNEVERVISARV